MPTRAKRGREEPEPVAKAKAAKPAAGKSAAKAAKPAAGESAAKAPAKAAKPAAAKSTAKKPSKKGTKADPQEFAEALLDVCKVLMIVCQTKVVEDVKKKTVTTTEDFGTHGKAILALLPEEAQLWMMKFALMFQEELDQDPYVKDDADDEGGADEDAEAEEDEEDEEDEVLDPELFYYFKQYFTAAEASELIESSKDGGAMHDAMEAALTSHLENDDKEEEEDEAEGEEIEEDDAEDDEDDDGEWSFSLPWKDE